MSNVKIQGNVSGTGSLTIAAPNTNSDRTLTLPDESGTLLTDSGAISVSASAPDNSVVVDASGNLGVGTTTINARVHADGGSSGAKIKLSNNTSGRNPTDGFDLDFTGTDIYIVNRENGNMIFENNGAERARIDTSGNLLVGTTSNPAGAKFMVGGSSTGIYVQQATGSGYNYTSNAASNGGTYYHFAWYSAGTYTGEIRASTTTTTYSTSSDYRLKHDIQPMTGALAKVSALKPCTYKWNADGSDGEGFIAHELAEVVPQCVTGEKDAVDSDGNPVYQGIDTSFLVATLTAAIQEQQAIITQLQADVAALKGAA